MNRNIKLKNKERYINNCEVDNAKIELALERALKRCEKSLERFTEFFPASSKYINKYGITDKVSWTACLQTGIYCLCYELTKNEDYLTAIKNHVELCYKTIDNNIDLNDHDMGFKFIPSLVAYYKLTGDEKAKEYALRAADIMLEHYCFVNNFVIRVGTKPMPDKAPGYRALVDSMMNIPLFFWASKVTGNKKYYDAAVGHYLTTNKYLIKEDGSSYHHYQFDPVTLKPVGGVTWQGNRDESCWSRGHSWLVYGYPIAYSYTKDERCLNIFKDVTNYFLNNLPSDFMPYWDFDFNDGSFEPRDSSALAIAICGLLEGARHLSPDDEMKEIYFKTAHKLAQVLSDTCECRDENIDGLILHGTGAKPFSGGIDTITMYGDYFYLEALVRLQNPGWKMFW